MKQALKQQGFVGVGRKQTEWAAWMEREKEALTEISPLENVSAYPELNRKVTDEEYEEVVDYAIGLGVEQGFIQEGETAEESFIPAFDGVGV